MAHAIRSKRFFLALKDEVKNDNVSNGAAALAYYLMLSIFPSLILLLSLVPYLPIPNVDQAILDLLSQMVPEQAMGMLSGVIRDLVSTRRGGLLSLGVLGAIWAASKGTYAVMQQLNMTYHVRESRPFWKVRAISVGLTFLVGALMVAAFSLVVLGGQIQVWITSTLGWDQALKTLFAIGRWALIISAFLMAFAVTYYFGPDVEQKFRFISPGSAFGVIALIGASLLFRLYAANFGNYNKMYGSIGAVIVLMLWLYITGWVLLLGSEINALTEHYSAKGKQKGEKKESKAA